MAAQIEILERLITEDKLDEAIILLEKNKENPPLKEAIKKNTSLLYLASYQWVKNNPIDEPTLWSLWKMESPQFNSYIQWPPQEVLEVIIELIPLRILFTLLLDYGANLDQIHFTGHAPLHLAVEHENLGLAQFLIQKGANINAKSKLGNTPLHQAILASNLELTQFFLENGAKINMSNKRGDTPLHFSIALYCPNWQLTWFLLEKGADINLQNTSKNSPLHLAAQRSNLELVQCLLEKGANINGQNEERDTPLHLATSYLNKKFGQFFLKKGANINLKNMSGNTPLHLAIRCSNWELAQFLVENGADINVQNEDGNTPLHLAIYHSSVETALVLIENGADINLPNNFAKSPLHVAVQKDNAKVVEQLILKDTCNRNVQDKNGTTPLHAAIDSPNPNLVQLLLSNRADVNVQDRNGDTPLHLAALKLSSLWFSHNMNEKYLEIANLLVNQGAKATIKNNLGEIPLYSFPESIHSSKIEVLKNIKKILSERAFLEQKEKQPASNISLAINHAPSSSISSNPSAFLQGIRHIFLKNCRQEQKKENTRPGP